MSVAETAFSTEELTEAEKDATLRFLGYPNWAALAQSIQLGYPAASQPNFLVFDAFRRIRPESRARLRQDLCRALDVECQIADSNSRVKTTKVGEVTLRADEFDELTKRLEFWTKRIADTLGVVPNPYSQMDYAGMPGGINAVRIPT
ncbi:MAG TPA: hypothetical protein ENK57_11920 [Polyangiaceae bacterium]|nr:hypothetical protein [Polyangiaceae bacterium]